MADDHPGPNGAARDPHPEVLVLRSELRSVEDRLHEIADVAHQNQRAIGRLLEATAESRAEARAGAAELRADVRAALERPAALRERCMGVLEQAIAAGLVTWAGRVAVGLIVLCLALAGVQVSGHGYSLGGGHSPADTDAP